MLLLNDREWKEFKISDIFTISPGKRLTKSDMVSGTKPFIGATDSNNGITSFISNTNASEDACVLGVNYNGSVVENFFHPYTCIFSDDVKRFRTKQVDGNKYLYLFLKTIILQQKSKYAYGYKFNEQRMQKQMLLLPVDKQGRPDYVFMEQYVKEREQQLIQKYIAHIGDIAQVGVNTTPLHKKEWKDFFIRDIFTDIQRGKRLKTADHIDGNVPYVSSSAVNNGVDAFIGNDGKVRKFNNCVTLANSGSVGKAFFHPYEFIASDHVTALYSTTTNKYSYIFIATIIERLQEKYSFNREINDVRLNKEKILLPVDEQGKPDYIFMEQYVKALFNRLKLQYLQAKTTS